MDKKIVLLSSLALMSFLMGAVDRSTIVVLNNKDRTIDLTPYAGNPDD